MPTINPFGGGIISGPLNVIYDGDAITTQKVTGGNKIWWQNTRDERTASGSGTALGSFAIYFNGTKTIFYET